MKKNYFINLIMLILPNLIFCQFNDSKSVVMYLSNKSFIDSSGSEVSIITFGEYAQNITIDDRRYKFGGVISTEDYIGNIEIYEYDRRLSLKFEINSKNNTVRQYQNNWGGLLYSNMYKFYPQNDIIPTIAWEVKGVYKIVMRNPRTGGYEEIMMLNPGQYIEIKNNQDILINKSDMFKLLFGIETLLFYNSAKFENGSLFNSNIPQTKSYKGIMELSNSNRTNISESETIVHFISKGGTNSVVISNSSCKGVLQLYYSDQVGLRME